MPGLESERVALRALALSPIEELPAYFEDVATTSRVGKALCPRILLSVDGQWALDKSLANPSNFAILTFYKSKARQSAKLAVTFPEHSERYLGEEQNWLNLAAGCED
jgi:hypothetical protein